MNMSEPLRPEKTVIRSMWRQRSRARRRINRGAVRRMPVLLASEFPEDPLMILRYEWPFLAVYYALAIPAVWCVWRSEGASRCLRSRKSRIIAAAILAAVFAPSEVSDFFTFNLPGPATVGLLLLALALPFAALSNPSALASPALWVGIATYYFIPLLVVFTVAYVVLSLYHRSHPGPVPPPNQTLQSTAGRSDD